MQVTHSFVNVEAFDGTKAGPHEIIERDASEKWLVAASPIRMDEPMKYTQVLKESHVYIPLIPYLMSPDPPTSHAFMLQLGMRVSFDVGSPIVRLHLSIGQPVHEVVDENNRKHWQFQVGFGVLLR